MCKHNDFQNEINDIVMKNQEKLNPQEVSFLLFEYASMVLYVFCHAMSTEEKLELIKDAVKCGKSWSEEALNNIRGEDEQKELHIHN